MFLPKKMKLMLIAASIGAQMLIQDKVNRGEK